jgi:hypothetical protein
MIKIQIAMFTAFAAGRKEPLADMIGRVHAAFIAAGFGEPSVCFTLADAPGSPEMSVVTAATRIKRVSSVGRVLKRWPRLEKFSRELTGPLGTRATNKVISNLTVAGEVEPVDFAILREITQGVPKSFPFHAITLHFSARGFSGGPAFPAVPDRQTLGMLMRAGVDIGPLSRRSPAPPRNGSSRTRTAPESADARRTAYRRVAYWGYVERRGTLSVNFGARRRNQKPCGPQALSAQIIAAVGGRRCCALTDNAVATEIARQSGDRAVNSASRVVLRPLQISEFNQLCDHFGRCNATLELDDVIHPHPLNSPVTLVENAIGCYFVPFPLVGPGGGKFTVMRWAWLLL